MLGTFSPSTTSMLRRNFVSNRFCTYLPLAQENSGVDEKGWNGELVQFGSMHEAIGLQQNQGRVKLVNLQQHPRFYGVGALEGLQGELTFIDGQPFVTGVNQDGEVESLGSQTDELQATLLIGASVSTWADFEATEPLEGERLENWIKAQAERVGIITSKPFPFLIEGEIIESRFHVINGACPVHARRRNLPIPADRMPFERESESMVARVVGIFAVNAAGKLTHPGISFHAHLVYEDEEGVQQTGHLEQLGIQAGAMLRLPQ